MKYSCQGGLAMISPVKSSIRAALPFPPHCMRKWPPGTRLARTPLRTGRWSLTQCKHAKETTRSNFSSKCRWEASATWKRRLGTLECLLAAWRIISGERSTPMTWPFGTISASAAVIRPSPHPMSRMLSLPFRSSSAIRVIAQLNWAEELLM